MINEGMAKEIESLVDKDVSLRQPLKPVSSVSSVARTVTADIESLKNKLDTIAKGINMLKDQL